VVEANGGGGGAADVGEEERKKECMMGTRKEGKLEKERYGPHRSPSANDRPIAVPTNMGLFKLLAPSKRVARPFSKSLDVARVAIR
jgi:hypothetical protein